MKTQILHLDPYDDASSTRERLRWARADRVVLVWPSHGRVLPRRLDLVLVQREAARQGARLGIVAHDPDVRDHASDLRIPVFDDLTSISTVVWPEVQEPKELRAPKRETRPELVRPEREASGRNDGPWRAGSMLIVIAALLALSVVVGPAAVIELTPSTRSVEAGFAVTFSQSATGESLPRAVPARTLDVVVQGDVRLPTTGSVLAPTERAEGFVVFTNQESSESVVPEGTGVRSGGPTGFRFETTARALLPPGSGAEVTVPIRAASAGEVGNVAAGTITAIEGPLGLHASVSNPEATSGGASEPLAGVTEDDLTHARSALERRLLQEATAEMTETLNEGEALAPGSVRIDKTDHSDSRPTVGEPSDTVFVEARLRISGLAYDVAALDELAASAVQEASGEGWEILPASVRVELEPGGASSRFRASATADTMRAIDVDGLAASISGRTLEVASRTVLEQVGPQAEPRLHLWPAWWPRLPILPWRIRLVWSLGAG